MYLISRVDNTDILCTEVNSKEKSFASELFYFLRENTSIFRLTDFVIINQIEILEFKI